MAELSGQPSNGGRAAEPRPPLLPHHSHQRPGAARAPRMRGLTVAEPTSREEYVRRVLQAYRETPGTTGRVNQPDRLLDAQLHQRGVPLEAVEKALVLAAARRLFRPADTSALAMSRSLTSFHTAYDAGTH